MANGIATRVDALLAEHGPWAFDDLTLPLTPIEMYLWSDDRPKLPLTFLTEMQFEGEVDVEAMQDAWRFTVGRQPLLRATIERGPRGYQWQSRAGTPNEMQRLDDSRPGETPTAVLDLSRECGARSWLHRTERGASVKLLFHHAVCDGQGARQVIQDLLISYAIFSGALGSTDAVFRLDPKLLTRRGEHLPVVALAENGVRDTWWRPWRDAWHFAGCTPPPLAGDLRSGHAQSPAGFCRRRLDTGVLESIEETARQHATSLNDVATGLLMQTLGQWQLGHGHGPQAPLRAMIPSDLRTREDERMPAANKLTFLFLDRRADQCTAWPELIAGIQAEMKFYRQTRFANEFLDGLALAAKVPALLRWGLSWQRSFATAVITNLSDPSRRLQRRLETNDQGQIVMGGCLGADLIVRTPPLRRQTHLGIGLCEYGRRLAISMRYNTDILSPGAAEHLLDDYVARWQEWLSAHAVKPLET